MTADSQLPEHAGGSRLERADQSGDLEPLRPTRPVRRLC